MQNKKFVRIVCLLLVLVMVFGLLIYGVGSISAMAISQADIDALEDERQAIRDQQQLVIEQMDALEDEKASVIERKEALDMQNELNRQEIEVINEQIAVFDQMIADKEAELNEAIAVEEEQFEIYCSRVRAMEENSRWTYLSYVLKAGSLSEMLGRLRDIMDIVEHDQNLGSEYEAAREFVEEVKAEYEEIQVQQEEKKAELLEEKAELEEEIEKAFIMIQELEDDIEAIPTHTMRTSCLRLRSMPRSRKSARSWRSGSASRPCCSSNSSNNSSVPRAALSPASAPTPAAVITGPPSPVPT